MKKITNILCIAGMGMMLFSACETDRDDNPTYHDASTFTLNEPENRVYDLGANDTIRLTLTQPDYGYTAATTYTVQVGLDSNFAEDNYTSLSTIYSSTSIALRPNEVNEALVAQYQKQHPGEETIGKTISAYIRLTAQITGSTLGASTSNVVALDQVKLGEVIQTLDRLDHRCRKLGNMVAYDRSQRHAGRVLVNGMVRCRSGIQVRYHGERIHRIYR